MAKPDIPLYALPGLEGNPPAYTLHPSQEYFARHNDALVAFWWTVWFTVLAIVIARTFVLPLLQARKKRP